MWPIEEHESSGVCHEMPPDITPIFKYIPNLKTPALCQSCQLACSKHLVPQVKQLTKAEQIKQQLCLEVPIELAVLSLLTNMLSALQADCYQVMAESSLIVSFMVAQFFLMLLMVLSGLKIKSLLQLEKLWWLRNSFDNVYGTGCCWNLPHS